MIRPGRLVVFPALPGHVYRWSLNDRRRWQLRPEPEPQDGEQVAVAALVSAGPCQRWNEDQAAKAAIAEAEAVLEEADRAGRT